MSVVRPLASCLMPFAIVACTTTAPTAPREGSGNAAPAAPVADEVPDAIAAPSSARLAVTLKGTGLQNYECRAKAGSSRDFEWAFVAPEATLKDEANNLVGRHYGGPTWEHGDGSKVTGTAVATVAAPITGNIPWLLLKATSSGAGVFSGVTFVQRIHTSGGIAPSDPCGAPSIGTRKAVRYSADYLFYKG